MNINLTTLNVTGKVEFNIFPDMSQYKNDDILSLNDVNVSGYIIDNLTDDYKIYLHIKGNALLKSARNNSDVNYPIDIIYDDYINNLVEIYKNSANTLDILPIVWENILLEIPIRAVNPQDQFENTSGNGWEIVSEDD